MVEHSGDALGDLDMKSRNSVPETFNSREEAIQLVPGRWTFGDRVAEEFDAHIEKSVPLYRLGHDLALQLSDFFVQPNSLIYELGCSTGTLIHGLAERHHDYKDARFIGIELESEMVAVARRKASENTKVTILQADLVTQKLDKSDFICSHYTMQFIRPKYRQQVFDKIYNVLEWGGAFLMFEKVRASDARFQDITSTLYLEFKQRNGLTNDEIVMKQQSLKGRMDPFTSAENVKFLKRAGFSDIITVQKYLCFEGWLAIK